MIIGPSPETSGAGGQVVLRVSWGRTRVPKSRNVSRTDWRENMGKQILGAPRAAAGSTIAVGMVVSGPRAYTARGLDSNLEPDRSQTGPGLNQNGLVKKYPEHDWTNTGRASKGQLRRLKKDTQTNTWNLTTSASHLRPGKWDAEL
jgi:hypothetical protein